ASATPAAAGESGVFDYRRPPARRSDSGEARSRAIAITPSTGPIDNTANAQRQPTARTTGGIIQIDTSVIANPTHVCVVRAVPTYAGGESSVTAVENCAESAMTLIPHTIATSRVSDGGPPKVSPISAAQAPLTAIAAIVSVVRPQRSAPAPAA